MRVKVQFNGGLELVTGATEVQAEIAGCDEIAMPAFLEWVHKNLVKSDAQPFLVPGGNVRPGILVLINDSDWELEGCLDYVVQSGDTITFITTLHGG